MLGKRLKTYNPLLYSFIHSIGSGARVLDVGCGPDSLFLELKREKEFFLTGIDIIPPPKIRDGFDEYFCLDLDAPAASVDLGSFDFIFCNHVLEHLHSHEFVEQLLINNLRSGGAVYLAGPNERTLWLPSIRFHMEQGTPVNFFDDRTHVRPLTAMSLFHLLAHVGVSNIHVKTRRDRLVWIFGLPKIIAGLLTGDRGRVVHTVWDVVGWEVQAVGRKG